MAHNHIKNNFKAFAQGYWRLYFNSNPSVIKNANPFI